MYGEIELIFWIILVPIIKVVFLNFGYKLKLKFVIFQDSDQDHDAKAIRDDACDHWISDLSLGTRSI